MTTKQNILKHITICFLLIAGSIFVFSACKNDPKEVKKITNESELPEVIINDMHTEITDSGKTRIIMDAPVMQRFGANSKSKIVYDEYPAGFTVKFLNKDTIESKITAEYAIFYREKNLWEAKRNVEAANLVNKEKINTEHLFWDMKKERIFTDKFVRITTKQEVFIGTGFESDQDFTSWKIKNPKGSFLINEEEEEQQN